MCQDKKVEDKLVADGKSLLYVFECEIWKCLKVNVSLYNLYLFIFIFSKSNLKVSDNENLPVAGCMRYNLVPSSWKS